MNKMLRLLYDSVGTLSNQRSFNKLKTIKNYLRSITVAKPQKVLKMLNSNKDILYNIDIKILVGKCALIKEKRIII